MRILVILGACQTRRIGRIIRVQVQLPAFLVQTDALEIEAQAKRRLADEYDAAQERGEVAGGGFKGNQWSVPKGNAPATVSDLGLTRKAIHEARQLRDAEAADPGVITGTF